MERPALVLLAVGVLLIVAMLLRPGGALLTRRPWTGPRQARRDLSACALGPSRRASAPVRVTVVAGEAAQLPGRDGEFDAVVASLVLCSVDDPAGDLAEMARVLRPGGELRFYEHVRSPHRWAALLEDAITPLWRRAAGGCHPNRDTEATIRAAGYIITDIERFGFSPTALVPNTRHILGTARKP